LDRSRVLLDRSRLAAAQFLAAPPRHPPRPPRVIEARQESVATPAEDEGALVGICSSVALRDLNLVDSLLAQLEEMEAKEQDQERLSELYRLDHLAARLRRNAENLRILAGRDAGEPASDSSSLVDIIRAAMSSIDHYSRVTIGRVVYLGVVGFAAEDLSRLLAELFDNAANQSPPGSPVGVSAHLTEQGSVLLRIEDEGIGLPQERLDEINSRLGSAPVLDNESVRHMGLAVVGRLARRHRMSVRIGRRAPHGTIATVLLPIGLVSEMPERNWSGAQTVVFPQAKVSAGPFPVQHRNSRDAGTSTALPRRDPTGSFPEKPRPVPFARPAPAGDGGSTPGGLPRRVSRSIKGSPEQRPPSTAPRERENGTGHDQLIADLGAFSEGEQAARDEADGMTEKGTQ
jgi:anti-sigma regulatory factor (Ser/Thr protein kinase)